MKKILTATLVFSFQIKAQVSPGHVEDMLDQMVKKDVITRAEAEKVRKRLESISPEQWTKINEIATKPQHARSPASDPKAPKFSDNKIEDVNHIDLDGPQFKAIQKDLSNIVPQHKD